MIAETNERSNSKMFCLFKSLRQTVSVTIEFLRSTVENLDNLSVRNIMRVEKHRTYQGRSKVFIGSEHSHYQGALMMEAVRTSETSVYFNETTGRYIPESCHLQVNLRPLWVPCHNGEVIFLQIWIVAAKYIE
jgi:hypothetical protein